MCLHIKWNHSIKRCGHCEGEGGQRFWPAVQLANPEQKNGHCSSPWKTSELVLALLLTSNEPQQASFSPKPTLPLCKIGDNPLWHSSWEKSVTYSRGTLGKTCCHGRNGGHAIGLFSREARTRAKYLSSPSGSLPPSPSCPGGTRHPAWNSNSYDIPQTQLIPGCNEDSAVIECKRIQLSPQR